MGVRLLSLAEEELAAAVEFYESQSGGLGAAFLAEVRHTTNLILESPRAGALTRGAIRRRLTRKFPYAILCAIEGSEIFVVAISHQRRRPDYCRNPV